MRPFHLAFPVDDLEKTREFYTKTLGCKAVSYTHLPSPRDGLLPRMPSSA